MNKISLLSHEEVQKHPANKSPTKISFRFPKSKRFQGSNPQCPIAFYSYRTELSDRKSSIGTGPKVDFLHEVKSPSSDKYNPDNYHHLIKHKGLSFGLSREQSPDQSYLIPQLYKNPGPGKYENEKQINNNSSYSIRPKTIDNIQRHLSYKNSPGPGAYQYVQLNPVLNKTKISKYQNAKLCTIQTAARFTNVKDTPSPHSYIELDNLSANARYIVSQHRGRGTRPFTREKRFVHEYWKPSKNPGPQQYEKPSDFGVYGDHNYYKGLSTID